MKFSEKLQTLRKAKKMSQEELSVLMDVSRQSVSKWESGTSYPEMDKLLQLCKIFSCTLDELTNDEIKEINVKKEEKVTPKNLVDNFFSGIETVYHFFTTREPKEIFRIVLEFFLFLFLFLLLNIPVSIILEIISDGFYAFDIKLFEAMGDILCLLAQIFYWIIAGIIYFRIFKIRYVNDQKNTVVKEEKKIEEEKIEESENIPEKIKIIESKSYGSFTNVLMKIIICFLKGIIGFFSLGLIGILIALCIVLTILIYGLFEHIIFIGFILCSLGSIALTVTLLIWFFYFIFNNKINLKKIIASLMINSIIISLSLGISLIELTNYEFIDEIPDNFEKKEIVQTLPYKENIYFENNGYYLYDGNITYEIDNTIEKDKIKIIYSNNKYYKRNIYINEVTNTYQVDRINNINTKDLIKDVKDNLRKKRFYNYNIEYTEYKILGHKETITKLKETMKQKREERKDIYYQQELNQLIKERDYLQECNMELLEENETYKNKIKEYERILKDLLKE